MARKQIVLTTDTFANMVSKINTMGIHVGDLDNLDASVPLDSDVVQVLNALYDSIGDYSLALNTDAQTLKGAINELEDSVETLKADRDSAAANIIQLNQDRDSAAAVMNQLKLDRDSDDSKAQELDSNQIFLLHALGAGPTNLGTFNTANNTYSGDISLLDDSINDKTSVVGALNDLSSQLSQIRTAAGLSEGNIGSLSILQDPIEGATVVASINLLRDSVQAMHDSTHIGGLTLDANRIGTNSGDVTLHDGFGSTVGTTFAKFEKYKDSDLKISAGDAGTTAIIIADSSVTIYGDLQVIGDANVNFETNDNIIVLNAEYEGATPTDNIGIQGNRDTHPAGDALIQWNENDSQWEIGVATDLRKVVRKGDANDVTTAMIQDDAVTNAKLRNSAGYSVIGKATTGAGDPADITIAANRVLGRDGTGNITGIQIDDSHISATAAIANNKLANSSITFNSVTVELGGSGVVDIAGSIDSLGAINGILTAGASRTYDNYSPISTYANDDSSQTIIMGHHPGMYNPANPNLPARTVLIGWHAGSTPDADLDNDGQLHNVAIGYFAGYNNDAREITAIGAEALGGGDRTTADGHTAVGFKALWDVSSSNNNTGVGNLAGANITTGSSNVAIGYRTGPTNAGGTAAENVFLGADAGKDGTTGNNNIVIGYNAQKSVATANNEIVLGNNPTGVGAAGDMRFRIPGLPGGLDTDSSSGTGVRLINSSGLTTKIMLAYVPTSGN